MRALYFLVAGATAQFRYLRPGLAVILAAVAAKLLLADVYTAPTWASPAFIIIVLAVVAVLSIRTPRASETTSMPNASARPMTPPSPRPPGVKPHP
jgi:predicted tellurium resistance membrane protein TerC